MSNVQAPWWAWVCLGVTATTVLAGPVGLLADVPASALTAFVNGTVTDADQVNANFEALRVAHNDLQTQVDAGGADPGTLRVLGRARANAGVSQIGNSWIDVPGAALTVTVPSGVTTRMAARGSITAVPDPAGVHNNTHCGFRVVVDGTPYGNSSWGDVIVGCSEIGDPASANGWWCPWTITRDATLTAGSHDIKLQMTGWDSSNVACRMDAEDYSLAVLDVLAY